MIYNDKFYLSSASDLESAHEALTQRPRLSIRFKIAFGFLLNFLLICTIIVVAVIFASRLGRKQLFLEKAGVYAFEIQQARRFEKNYLLYGSDLYDALSNVSNAQQLLETSRAEFSEIIGVKACADMAGTLERYHGLLERLDKLAGATDFDASKEQSILLKELRRVGAKLVTDASNAIDQERLTFHTWLHSAKIIAVAALAFILMFEIVTVAFIAHQLYLPFKRFENYMRRIAAGDFSPITPVKKYRDEFTDLAIAVNRMLKEIQDRGNQLIEIRKMASIGTLTAGIAHEINNPLNNISLTTEALIDDFAEWSEDEKMDMLKDVYSQVERAAATVANLLDFTQRDLSAFKALNIKDVLDSAAALVANELRINNITLDMKLDSQLPNIRGHNQNLQQVFLNLFLNAIEAMNIRDTADPGGGRNRGGKLTVTGSAEGNFLRVDVIDTGVGIPQSNLGRIFDPFFTTKEVGKGAGLGLSVCFGIIGKHHGSITAKSEEGKGTTLTVRLPIAGDPSMDRTRVI